MSHKKYVSVFNPQKIQKFLFMNLNLLSGLPVQISKTSGNFHLTFKNRLKMVFSWKNGLKMKGISDGKFGRPEQLRQVGAQTYISHMRKLVPCKLNNPGYH